MTGQASKVSGVVQIDGTPAQRIVRAFGYEAQAHAIDGNEVTLSRTLGHATSDPATGEYTIDLLAGYPDPIFVVAFDDYGADFTPDKALSVGDRIHPTTPNGHVFECTGAGTLPSEEPTWIVDTETAQLYGTASMIAKPFYRPMVHGPVAPEVTALIVGDEFFNSVALLLHFDETTGETAVIDSSSKGITIQSFGAAQTSDAQSKFGNALALDGNGSYLVAANPALQMGDLDFTIEWFQYLNNTDDFSPFDMRDGANPSARPLVYNIGENLIYYVNGSVWIEALNVLLTNTWQHIAISRASGTTRLFINGVQKGSFADTFDYDPTNLYIGRNTRTTARDFDGYLDEFRITVGHARYANDFTPPTQPFPNSAPQSDWTPANLFSSNEVGAWYDPSDLTTLFQDATVNQPVQNDGDPVGLMLDKSGNGLIAFQEDAAKRPIFRTNGSESWLEFSGGQKLKTEAIGLGPNWVAAAGYSTTVNAFQSVIDGDDSSSSSTRVGQFIRVSSAGKAETIGFNTSATAFPVAGALSITSGQAVTHISKMENGTLTLFQDGVSQGSLPVSGTPASANIPIGIGARTAQSLQFFDGKLFSLVLLAQSGITADNQRELEAYISKTTGAT